MPVENMAAAMKRGDVDAVSGWEPGAHDSIAALGADAAVFQDRSVYRELFDLNTTTAVLDDPVKRRSLVDAVRAMEAASGQPLGELRADGGATANGWLMQFQADVLGVPVLVPEVAETTALGAAYLAGVGAGAWTLTDVGRSWRERRRYEPRMSADERAGLLGGWSDALARARARA